MFFQNQYFATVRDEGQQITKCLVSAANKERAILQLKKHKYRVVSIEQRPNPIVAGLKQGRLEFGNPASKRDLATFSNNLSLMG